MAAGLGFKTFAVGEVLSAANVNGYLMQGVLVFTNAASRDAAITSPQEGQFAYLKDTNVTTYYTGSAWANLDTTGMTNPMTTTGDTIYSSSGSTPARLGIGTAGQVLTVNTGATAPEWVTPAVGSGMTLLSTTSLSGSSTTISSISGSYIDLAIYITDWDPSVDGSAVFLRFNGDTSNNYSNVGGAVSPTTPTLTDKITIIDTSIDDTVLDGLFYITLPYYSNTATFKIADVLSIAADNSASPRLRMLSNFAAFNSTSAISSITVFPSSGTATATAYIYGVK